MKGNLINVFHNCVIHLLIITIMIICEAICWFIKSWKCSWMYQFCGILMRCNWEIVFYYVKHMYPDSKVHGANMGPIWSRQDPGGPHVGSMNFAIRVLFLLVLFFIVLRFTNILTFDGVKCITDLQNDWIHHKKAKALKCLHFMFY